MCWIRGDFLKFVGCSKGVKLLPVFPNMAFQSFRFANGQQNQKVRMEPTPSVFDAP